MVSDKFERASNFYTGIIDDICWQNWHAVDSKCTNAWLVPEIDLGDAMVVMM